MNKSELIQKILDEVKTSLERDIPENFNNFEIKSMSDEEINIICLDQKKNENSCYFVFNWYN